MRGTPPRRLPPGIENVWGEMEGFMRHRMKGRGKDTIELCCVLWREGHHFLGQAILLTCYSIEIYGADGQRAHL